MSSFFFNIKAHVKLQAAPIGKQNAAKDDGLLTEI
jgi:hypothetical protein